MDAATGTRSGPAGDPPPSGRGPKPATAPQPPALLRAALAEVLGTGILVFFGLGAVHAAILAGAQTGLWQVAVVWAVAIALAIYAVGATSGAHINPAITLAFACRRRFPWNRVWAYLAAQLLGAFLAAAALHLLFAGAIASFEQTQGLSRGQPGSQLSAMLYAGYFPHPAIAAARGWTAQTVGPWRAFAAEMVGTAFLAFFVFALTDRHNGEAPGPRRIPPLVGLGVAAIIAVIAPLTMAGLNPARDFGPRLFAACAGWGRVAIPGPQGGFFTVYILAPCFGALAGALVYEFALGRANAAEDAQQE